MRLHQVKIRNFRGIKELDWKPEGNFTCLIGPGDSTKTTLLDAISAALSTRTSLNLCDADFYNCDVEQDILIEVILADLPNDVISLDSLGSYICGIATDGTINADPEDEDIKGLAVRFRVDKSLEPLWEVYKPNTPELSTRHLPLSTRLKFGVFRVDERVETHLRWGRGSALAAITAGLGDASSTTVDAQRAARTAVFNSDNTALTAAAEQVKSVASTFGASDFANLRVGLDPQALNTGYGLVLHDGDVPLTAVGLGTRRLTSLGIQEARTVGANLILIDEIETGLEPHRLHHLLKLLLKRSEQHGTQIIMTTHAPLVVEELGTTGLTIVRCSDEGKISVKHIPKDLAELDNNALQKTIRSGPSAMLASRILVVEGSTEMGLLRPFAENWDTERLESEQEPLAVIGTAVRNGGGDELCLKRSTALAKLGYKVGSLLDSDKPLSTEESDAASAGTTIIRWGDDLHLEGRIVRDLPDNQLHKFVEAAILARQEDTAEELDDAVEAILNSVSSRVENQPSLDGSDPANWASTHSISFDDIRAALSTAAHKNKWFKDEQRGAILGKTLLGIWPMIEATPLGQRLQDVKRFIYDIEE